MATDYKVGDKIILFKRHQEAIIRYIGETKFAPNTTSFGLELIENGIGDNNGTVNDIKYFECPKNKGLFVWEKDIKFKIQPRKRSIKNIKSPRKTSTPISVNEIYSEPVRTPTLSEKNSKSLFSRKSIKKLGPRDVGRNDNYKGIEDEPLSPKSSKKKKKTKKKKQQKKEKDKANISLKKLDPTDVGRNDEYQGTQHKIDKNGDNKSKRKQSKKKKIKGNKKTVNKTKNVEPTPKEMDDNDSDSYKSGYSRASGHSQYSLSGHYVDHDDDGLIMVNQEYMERDEITTDGINDSDDLFDSYDDKESDNDDDDDDDDDDNDDNHADDDEKEEMEDDEEEDLMQKVMLMMKQKEEEKEEKERERELEEQRNIEMDDKIVLVAMTHKQMNENNEQLSLFEDDEDDEPIPHEIGGDTVENGGDDNDNDNNDDDDDDDDDDNNDDDDDNDDNNNDDDDDDDKEMTEDVGEGRDDGEEEEMEGNIVNGDKKNEYDSDIDDDLPPPNRADLELNEEGSARFKSYAKRKGSEHDKVLDKKDDIKSEEDLDAMRMSNIYKRLSMKSIDMDKVNNVDIDTNQMYMNNGNMTMDWNKEQEKEEEEEEEEETDVLSPKKEGKTINVDEEQIALTNAQQNGCCIVL